MIQEIDIYIIFGLILVFLNTIFYFKKSGNIVENWFGRCRREVIRRCNDATTSYRNHYTKNILKQLQNKKNPLNSAISIQTEYVITRI